MAPHILKLASAPNSANSCLTPLWPECVMKWPGDNAFFTLLFSLSLCLVPYLSLALFVFTSLCPFPPRALRSPLIVAIFLGTACTVIYRKSLYKSKKKKSKSTESGVLSGACGSHRQKKKKKKDVLSWDPDSVASNRSSTWMWPELGEVKDRYYNTVTLVGFDWKPYQSSIGFVLGYFLDLICKQIIKGNRLEVALENNVGRLKARNNSSTLIIK